MDKLGVSIEQVSNSIYNGVSAIINNARQKVAVYVNSQANMMFWQIGNYIINELKYETYSSYGEKILATVSQTLSWGHFLELITINDNIKRLFYQQLSIVEHWSIRDLREKQKAMSYERSLIATKSEDQIINALNNTTSEHIEPAVVLKSSYIVDFLGLGEDYSESDLEDAIVKQLEKFILELGQGFAFLINNGLLIN